MSSRAGWLVTAVLSGIAALHLVALPLVPNSLFLSGLAVLTTCGMLLGIVIGVSQWCLRRSPARLRLLIWAALGMLAGVSIASRLGAFHKLGSSYRALAAGTIASAVVACAAVGGVAYVTQPDMAGRTPLAGFRAPWRWALLATLLLGAVAGQVAEVTVSVLNAYPTARHALAGLAWTSAFLAAHGVARALPWSDRALRATAICLAMGSLACAGHLASTRIDYNALANSPPTEHAIALFRWATDWDRDGASSFFGGGDCGPWNPAQHPRALEIPGNGLDDNCRYGDAPPKPTLEAPRADFGFAPSPVNVVLITIDSLRPDHTSPYGYRQDTTPNLREFAKSAMRFDRAYTSGGWTCIALPTMLIGAQARYLQWGTFGLTYSDTLVPLANKGPDDVIRVVYSLLRSTPWTLQKALQTRGMHTIAALHGFVLHRARSVAEGWDAFRLTAADDDRLVTELALQLLRTLPEKPFFLWVHYYNPHARPQDRSEAPGGLVARYDKRISVTDTAIGDLLSVVDTVSSRPTVIAVASDHGEILEDPNQIHGADLFEESLRIPLLLRAPGLEPGSSTIPVSLVDLVPTILALTRSPAPAALDGTSLLNPSPERVVISDLWRTDHEGTYIDLVAISDSEFRLTYNFLRNTSTLTRTGDSARPPETLDMRLAPPRVTRALATYLEYQAISLAMH